MTEKKGKGKGKSEKKGKEKGSGKGKIGKGKGKDKGKMWEEEHEEDWEESKGKGKGKSRENAQAAANRLQGKEYEDAVNDLIENTALQVSDFDPWMVKLLDALQFWGNAEDACNVLKENLGDRTRDQIRNPRAYAFTLLTKFKKETQMMQQQAKNGFASKLNADAPEFVFVPNSGSNFSFSVDAPEFSPSTAPTTTPSSPTTFSADAPEFVPGKVPTTPEMGPKSHPDLTPEKVFLGQALHDGMTHNLEVTAVKVGS